MQSLNEKEIEILNEYLDEFEKLPSKIKKSICNGAGDKYTDAFIPDFKWIKEPAEIHDWLYFVTPNESRWKEISDYVFYQEMMFKADTWYKKAIAWIYYQGVKYLGYTAFRFAKKIKL